MSIKIKMQDRSSIEGPSGRKPEKSLPMFGRGRTGTEVCLALENMKKFVRPEMIFRSNRTNLVHLRIVKAI